jgi:hypothetical protein
MRMTMQWAVVLSFLMVTCGNAGAEEFASSFAGLGFDVDGVRLDLPAEDSLKGIDPKYRLKIGKWRDSQGNTVREDIGQQNYTKGNIRDVREEVSISVTPWHTGNLIERLIRKVAIKSEAKMPTIDDFVAATKSKYGEPAQTLNKGIGGLRAVQLVYFVKDGKVANVPCFDPEERWNQIRASDAERITTIQRHLDSVNSSHCDAVLSIFYTGYFRNPERISHYGAYARDFRLEFESFLADVKQKQSATEARQAATPKVAPEL